MNDSQNSGIPPIDLPELDETYFHWQNKEAANQVAADETTSPNVAQRMVNAVQNFLKAPSWNWKLVAGVTGILLGTFLFDYRISLILLGLILTVWYLDGEE